MNLPEVSDEEAPLAPVMAAPSGISSSAITFNWLASTDNVAVIGYKIELDIVG